MGCFDGVSNSINYVMQGHFLRSMTKNGRRDGDLKGKWKVSLSLATIAGLVAAVLGVLADFDRGPAFLVKSLPLSVTFITAGSLVFSVAFSILFSQELTHRYPPNGWN